MTDILSDRKSEENVNLSLVRVCLHVHPEDSFVEYFQLSPDVVEKLTRFVDSGEVGQEMHVGLEAALRGFPAWAGAPLTSGLTKEQRQSVAGSYAISNGRKVCVKYALDLDVTVY